MKATDREERVSAMDAMGKLYQAYWYPLYAFVRRKGWREEEAQDQTQIFFQRLIEQDFRAQADKERGKLRTFLLTALQRQLANAAEAAQARKRGGGQEFVSLDMTDAEGRYQIDPADASATPEMVFDKAWAMLMLETAVDRLGSNLPPEEFAALKPMLTMNSKTETSYAEISAKLGITEESVRQKVSRLRKRLPIELRTVVTDSLQNPTDEAVDEEIACLRAALRGDSVN